MRLRWVPRTLRVRLTAWHVGVMVVVLAIYASVVLLLVTRSASATLNAQIRSDFRWAAEMAQQGPDGSLSWFEGDAWSEDSPWLQVWSPSGQLIYRTAGARRFPVPESAVWVPHADGQIMSVPARGMPFRLLGGRATIGGEPVVIQVGRSEGLMRQELRELALVLLLGLPLSVAAAGVGGYVLARGALAPLDRMTDRARAITAARLHDRLPIDNPNDELGRLASVFNDTLGRLESSFRQMRRFTANVSHEVRTPLTAIRSVGEVGLREHRDAEAYRAVIGSMLEDTDRLTCLVDRLLTVSRAESGDVPLTLDTIDLCDMADNVTAHLGVLAEEKQQSMTIERAGHPTCRGDRIVLRQAVINLVDNAIKYTPVGGEIRIRVSASADAAVLEVSDTGPGIPAGRETRMFDRFDRGGRTDEPDGTGLGLSIAKWAVEANLGQLSHERVNGYGSTFRITLPGVQPLPPALDVKDHPSTSSSPW